jgi:hypothetical protein
MRHVKIHDGGSARNLAIAALLRDGIAEQRRYASRSMLDADRMALPC